MNQMSNDGAGAIPVEQRVMPHEPRTNDALAKTIDSCGYLSTEAHGALTDCCRELEHEVAYYRRRVRALEQLQSRMRDPERTMVCDIIANGFTMDPPIPADRYELKTQRVTS